MLMIRFRIMVRFKANPEGRVWLQIRNGIRVGIRTNLGLVFKLNLR